jgi:hypothetical protein
MHRTLLLLLATLAACARKDAPPTPPASSGTAAEDTLHIVTSIGRGALAPRWVGLWTRTTNEGIVGLDIQLGGSLRLVNLCDRRGVTWQEVEGGGLALRTTAPDGTAPREERYALLRFDDSVMALAGSGPGQGRWTRTAAPVGDRCGAAP